MNAHTDRARWLFACLGDASRYRIVAALSGSERCVSELARDVALSQSCTTRHLQALQRVGLVSRERQGKRVVFRLRTDDVRVEGLLEWIRRESLEDAPAPPSTPTKSGAHEARSQGAAPRSEGPVASEPATAVSPRSVEGSASEPERSNARESESSPPARRSQDLEDYLL